MVINRFFYDVETTGLHPNKNSIHQLSIIIEIDGVIKEKLDLRIRPHKDAIIDAFALSVSGVTEEQVLAYPSMESQFKVLIDTLKKYVNPYDKASKFFMIGFKNASFDDEFLKKYFSLMGSKFYLYFFANAIDVSVLASQYLINIRYSMPTFKLGRVAKTLGITVLDEGLHDAMYDTELTREIYYIVCKFEENLF